MRFVIRHSLEVPFEEEQQDFTDLMATFSLCLPVVGEKATIRLSDDFFAIEWEESIDLGTQTESG